MEEREKKISEFGFNSKERILADEEIKTYIDESESSFKELKKVAFKNKDKLSPIEIDSQGKELGLLRKNLNLMSKQLKAARSNVSNSKKEDDSARDQFSLNSEGISYQLLLIS